MNISSYPIPSYASSIKIFAVLLRCLGSLLSLLLAMKIVYTLELTSTLPEVNRTLKVTTTPGEFFPTCYTVFMLQMYSLRQSNMHEGVLMIQEQRNLQQLTDCFHSPPDCLDTICIICLIDDR